jgi:hypothetical protein
MVDSLNSYLRSNFLNGASLAPDVKYQDVVDYVSDRLFEGDEEPTSILNFESGKKLALNQTNLKTIIAMYGPHPDNLIGKLITYRREMVPFGGKMVPGVRVAYVSPGEALGSPGDKPQIAAQPSNVTPIVKRWERHDGPPSAPPPESEQGDGPGERFAGQRFDDDIPF